MPSVEGPKSNGISGLVGEGGEQYTLTVYADNDIINRQ